MRDKRVSWYGLGVHAVLAIACLLILLLARENRSLEERLASASLASAGGPKIHDLLPALPVADLEGAESVLAFDAVSRNSVVLVFTTTCPACQKNLEPWLDLHEAFGDRYRFVAVSFDPPEETRRYAEEHALPFPVVTPADRAAFQKAYSITGVPQTLVVGTDGRVIDTQAGVLPQTFRARLG